MLCVDGWREGGREGRQMAYKGEGGREGGREGRI